MRTVWDAPLAELLLTAGASDAIALVDGDARLSFSDLGDAVGRRVPELDLGMRSLVVVQMTNTLESVVTYLAVLAAGHVPLLTGEHHGALATAWDANAVVVDGAIERRASRRDRDLHPDLALLLSTSGSTGSPKLVRLSHGNLVSNALAIGEYLGLTPADRGITTLPLHYCYGLSILHSHLAAGAGVVLSETSVVDPCFARAIRSESVTNVAGVPHTFELLERAGPDIIDVPSLRLVTQAGGRLAPEALRDWRARTSRWGVDLFVMYGQTEATARMAYLPPDLAEHYPNAIGRPIPGGHIELRPVPGEQDGVGEIVYRGPNVMMGYATAEADLCLGATIGELGTGDLARHHADVDVYEIVGRRSRFIKPFGLRIDLDAIERMLSDDGIAAVAGGDDRRLVVCVTGVDPVRLRAQLVDRTGVPATAIAIDDGPVPRTPNGKVDYAALARRAGGPPETPEESGRASVAAVYASVLGRTAIDPSSTFVSLGGDSLSYIECSIRLEQSRGRLPADWHLRTVAELDTLERRRGLPRFDTTILLRTAGILAIVSTHMRLMFFPGGSHLLLAVVGYNISRFQLSLDSDRARVMSMLRSISRVAVPAAAFVGVCMLLVGGYGLPTLTLVNNYLGPPTHLDGRWHYWFVESMVQILLVMTLIVAVKPLRWAQRRLPYLFPLALLAGALVLREQWVTIDGSNNLRYQTHGVAWFFVLGWLAHSSRTLSLRAITTAVCLLTVPDFFVRQERSWFIAIGILALIWLPRIPVPRLVSMPVTLVAAASMSIFITHFRIFPVLQRNLPNGWAYALTIVAGVAIWMAVEQLSRLALPTWRRLRSSRSVEVHDRPDHKAHLIPPSMSA